MHNMNHLRFVLFSSLLTLVCLGGLSAATPIETSQVTVYRCTDGKGHIAIQDVACAPNHAQEVSKMARPKDSPAPKTVTSPASPNTRITLAPTTAIVIPRRPAPDLYQCTDFDGKVRDSEFYDPRPRCVPLWVQGYQSPTNACSWVEDSCYRYEGKALCDRWIAKQKQAVLNADRPSAENTDFKKAEAARLTQIVKDSCW